MSRIGQKAIDIPSGVTVSVSGSVVTVKGPKGELSRELRDFIRVTVEGGKVLVARAGETRLMKGCHGLSRTLIANMIEGVSRGFSKDLEIQGVGFKAVLQGRKLILTLGFSSPIEFELPVGINVTLDGGTKLTVAGSDKELVGDTAARIRSYYPAEPYKGKGVRYKDEYVRRKVGKSVA
jgi:large subunit ribosomal protein L6